MAGRKTPPKPDILTMLLGKMGLAPVKKKKGKRRKGAPRKRPEERDLAAYAGEGSFADAVDAESGDAPFGDYGQASGLGFDDESYEAAAAAGYAPPAAHDDAPEPDDMPAFAMSAEKPVPPPADSKLFNMEALDNSLDALFSGLESGEAPTGFGDPVPAPEPEPAPAPAAEKPVPAPIVTEAPAPEKPAPPRPIVTEPAPAPKPARPVATAPAAYPAADADRELATVLPLAAAPDLMGALQAVDRAPGVLGSLLVGHDGLIITATLPPEMDCDYLGAQASSLFADTHAQARKMRRGDLRRMALETENGVMLLMAADMGILVVVSEDGRAMDATVVQQAIAGALDA